MASFIEPDAEAAYCGLPSIFEFTNADGDHIRTNCGQAACATFLTHHKRLPTEQAGQLMTRLEANFPPDNLGGLLGTSRRSVTRICRAFGLKVDAIEGEEALRTQLASSDPVIVMLSVVAGRLFRWPIPGGHWMVAYGFDEDHVYLTNWGRMPWEEFRAGWAGVVPRLINMRRRGLAVKK